MSNSGRDIITGTDGSGSFSEYKAALVIGNSDYADTPLRNPLNDAAAVAQVLRELDFEVNMLTDANRKQMKAAIRQFGDCLHRGGVGLFYFAGHGLQVNGKNYLIPIGAEIHDEYEVDDESLNVGLVLGQMERANNRVNIVILDACRNNPYERGFRSTVRGLASIDAPRGTLIAYSAAPGMVAEDGTEANSPYTRELVKQVQREGLGIMDVFMEVRKSVMEKTRDRQIPWESTSLTSNFYFRSAAAVSDRLEEEKKHQQKAQEAEQQKAAAEQRKIEEELQRKIEEEEKSRIEEELRKAEEERRRIVREAERQRQAEEEQQKAGASPAKRPPKTKSKSTGPHQASALQPKPKPKETRPQKSPMITPSQSAIILRNKPQKELSEAAVKQMLKEKGFYDSKWNKGGKGFQHQYAVKKYVRGNVVIDGATGLMWQQSGSSERMTYDKAKVYLNQLNREKLAGFDDWRLPTLEEAMSLMERENNDDDLYIDPFFDGSQGWIWTSDQLEQASAAWIVDFYYGCCDDQVLGKDFYIRAVRSGQSSISHFDLNHWTEALLACSSMQDVEIRRDIVQQLRGDIRNAVPYRAAAKASVHNIVRTCRNYEGGLEELVAALRTHEGNSEPMQVVEQMLEDLLSENTVPGAPPSPRRDISFHSVAPPAPEEIETEDLAVLQQKAQERYHLCLIAVQDYAHLRPLSHPLGDAERLREILTRRYRFAPEKVTLLANPTREHIFHELAALKHRLGNEDSLLLFFAGHGEWDENAQQGYWLPRDAREDHKASWVSNSDIADLLKRLPARHVLVLSDACFSGAIFQTRSAETAADKAIAQLYRYPSRQAITSGIKESVPDASVFLKYLLKRLEENQKSLLRAGELYESLREAVLANGGHNPQFGLIPKTGHEGGEFLFFLA